MKFTVCCVGRLQNTIREAAAVYEKRLQGRAPITVKEVAEEKMPSAPSAATMERIIKLEGERLLRQVPVGAPLIVLDVAGREMTSEEFSAYIAKLELAGHSRMAFAIGGAFGISPEVKGAADLCLSLSRLTFTHQMARLLLFEQLYRAVKINAREPYHNA